jgi:tripartite-type tricarboxylate transporter receptor subunit TctC
VTTTDFSSHVASALFQLSTRLDLVEVPYRGGAPALTDLLAEQVQVMFDNLPISLERIKGGEVRPLQSKKCWETKARPSASNSTIVGLISTSSRQAVSVDNR